MTRRIGFRPAPAFVRAAALLACLLASGSAAFPQNRGRDDEPGRFDFYVLALSWSPSYCEAEGAGADQAQCNAAKPLGFVVHGLWPQYERGSPERCDAASPVVPRPLARSISDLIPSFGLVQHEWRTHGTCSGLEQADYFALLRKARERVTIPAQFRNLQAARQIDPRQLEQAFVRANPSLDSGSVAVTCDGNLMREVRICMSRDLYFRACAEVDHRGCRRRVVEMPAMSAN